MSVDFDFMEQVHILTENVNVSVSEESFNQAYVDLATLLHYAHMLYMEQAIDKKMYYKTLNFYEKMHSLILERKQLI